jgi:hypothetical protein
MAPRRLLIFLIASLSLILGLTACLPIPFTGRSEVLSPEEVQATVQAGIDQTLTAQQRMQQATQAALPVDEAPVVPLVFTQTPQATETVAVEAVEVTPITEAPASSPTPVPATPTGTPTDTLEPTYTPTETIPPPTATPAATETPQPSPTLFDPNTPTPTPPPTITPQGYAAPPETPAPPEPAATEPPAPTLALPTPEPELAAPQEVLLQVETAAYCRSGPGRSFDLLDVVLPEEWALVTGRSSLPNYYIITTQRGASNCWLWTRTASVYGSLESLPLLAAGEAPPLPMFTAAEETVCRAGPAETHPEISLYAADKRAEIIGRAEEDAWLLVRIPPRGVICWVAAGHGEQTGNLAAAPMLGEAIPPTGSATRETPAVEQPEEPQPQPPPAQQPPAAQPPAVQPVLTPVAGTACRIMSQSPSANTTISPNASFEASWTVRNIGTNTWGGGLVDAHYLAGSRMHRTPDRFELPHTINTGEAVTIRLTMVAPANPGRYNITWALSDANGVAFCVLPLAVEVR